MRLRQEQIAFLAGLLVLALLAWRELSGSPAPVQSRTRAGTAELVHHGAPDLGLVLPDPAAAPALVRALFAPPRDTRPLPPLDLVEPPRRPLAGLLPPPVPGPAPAAYGALLRREVPAQFVADLFASFGAAGGEEGDDEFFAATEEEKGERSTVSLLQAAQEPPDPFADETPEERTARLEGYKKRYDWILRSSGGLVFGRIENPDRFDLVTGSERASEPILFVEIDPVTGRETQLAVGAPALPYHRATVLELGFAGTPANWIELRRREIGEDLTRGSYAAAVEFAGRCTELRLEAPAALAVAERTYRLCMAFDPQDPLPPLGLGRAYEAGFRFEDAFDLYRSLLATFPLRAEVHVRLAELEERFLLTEVAGERFRRAVEVDKAAWEARRGLGRHLVRTGEHSEAIEHLEQASRLVPNAPELLAARVAIRTELAGAYLAAGRLADARRVYEQAVRGDETHQPALAGLLVTSLLDAAAGAPPEMPELEENVGFELLVAGALQRMLAADHTGARDQLALALDADPLRAHVVYDALAFLAEITENEADALGFVDLALEAHPGDAWALFERGRLLGRLGDYEGAREALLGALEIELDFEDALVALGETAFRLGRFEDAERYLERTVELDSARGEVHALRGLNSLHLGAREEARDAFQAALGVDPADPVARAGDAWCTYLAGETTEALIQLADLDDRRRDLPADDPYRVWAKAQSERIQEHGKREEFTDAFNRKRLANGWVTDEGLGPEARMAEGAVEVRGVFTTSGTTRVYREYGANLFASLEADVWLEPTNVRAGIFIVTERARRAGESEITHEASVTRHKDGSTQVRLVRSGRTPEVLDMEQPFPTGEWVRLRIERQGEGSEAAVTLFLNGIPLVESARLAGIAQGTLRVGLLVEGEVGREARVRMDNAAVVYRVE
ncbi:MAG: tetratricopeptide repeat protein [Planctomycetota bacterium]